MLPSPDVNAQSLGAPSTGSVFVVIVILVALLLGGVFTAHFYVEQQAEKTRQQDTERLNVNLARNALVADLDEVTTDLLYLKTVFEQKWRDPADEPGLKDLADLFLVFAEQKGIYDQIRYLDTSGREIIRVNWSDRRADLSCS